ncbi:MAG: hypothetical protein IJW99_03775 [Clostridia bacterium]|nr:hypothetical protein [Clostridia bacterium]
MLLSNIRQSIRYKPICLVLCVLLTVLGMLGMLLGSALVHIASAPEEVTALTIARLPQSFVPDGKDFYDRMNVALSRSSFVQDTDLRVYARGYSETWHSCVPSDQDYLVGTASSAVFAAKLVEAKQVQSGTTNLRYRYLLEIVQPIVMHEIYAELGVGSRVEMTVSAQRSFDMTWLEQGKTYLFCGNLQRTENAETEYELDIYMSGMSHRSYKIEDRDGKHCLYDDHSGSYIPMISELHLPVEDFFKTEMGQLWQKRVIPEVKSYLLASHVIGTGILESIRAFNLDETVIIAGETFTTRQLEQGEAVCLISEELAKQNGLSVGDSFLWKLQGVQRSPYTTRAMHTYMDKNSFSGEIELRVVGIYRNTEPYENIDRGVHPNTVFVPVKLVKPAEPLKQYDKEQLSVVLGAGEENAFELEMKEFGYGNLFEYHSGPKLLDTETQALLQTARAQLTADAESLAKGLYLFGALLILSASFLLMWYSHREIGHFYRIETGESVLFGHLFGQMLAMAVLSAALSAATAVFGLVPAARAVLYHLADAAWAEMILARLPETLPFDTAFLFGTVWSLLCGAVFAAIGMKRSYYYEYRKEGET